ncbi:hypothetical protein [Sulfitobacter sp.]|uniref:hypothetical protein n=1 Tax=Sulfitobacter sp. TaxID=1903071 RepID=UPI003EF36AC0
MPKNNRFKTFDFWDGAVFGVTVTSIIALIIAWLLSGRTPEDQRILVTLIAIPVAFFGAFVSLSVVRYQINNTRTQDLASARVVLPLALTRMMSVADNGILLAASQHTIPITNLADARNLLTLDEKIIDILRDNVRAADPITRKWLSVTIARYQVYHSRIDGWWNSSPPTVNASGETDFSFEREDALMDWATFYALVEHLFEYAREVVDNTPERLDASRIRSAYFKNIFAIDFTSAFEQKINIRVGRLLDGKLEHFQFHR